ncbi:LuxR family transcriptional regulator [Streptomyces sp. Act143]|uniref:AAA family ATPase n=1 Tax=Streptomyces sp. Act143 TaxID=2200760 RepID=UPI000D675C8C|nr:LuxR family transcriptional regulator [Streptomyces sp. Act143]PWI19385.1 LuxR family transcriptional regulator [Streptomyces sp. Act143]
MPGTAGPELRGRRSERQALDRLLAGARAGQSQVLAMTGEAGVGKTALLDDLASRADGFQVLRVAGVESEMELVFAGLHQLCAASLDQLDRLPAPQRDALGTAFGLHAGEPPSRFLVALAALNLLAGTAEEHPLLCLIDDLQWLDQASVLTLVFMARRLLAEPIAFVFAGRPGDDMRDLNGFPQLALGGLGESDARALVSAALPGPLDAAVLDQIIAESQGNPLALLEMTRAWNPADAAGGFALLDAMPPAHRIERVFAGQLQQLPRQTRQLLVTAAAEPTGDPGLLWRAAAAQGIDVSMAAPAETAGLIEFGVRVRFRHPLVRSAAYRSASAEERRDAHSALAQATDAGLDPDRLAWHRAQAATEPDETLAAELERSADRAQARGGLAAAAAFLERAVAVTPERPRQVARALAASQAKLQAGASGESVALLAVAQAGPLDDFQQATVGLLRGQLAFASSQGRSAPALLLSAAQRMERFEPATARDTYLDAFAAALFVGRLRDDVGLVEIAAAARGSARSGTNPPDLLLGGLTALFADGYEAGAPHLKRAVAAFRDHDLPPADALRWLWLASNAAHDLWDDDSWKVLSERFVGFARQAGALGVLPIALSTRIGLHLFAGELTLASALVEEVDTVTQSTDSRLPAYGAVALAAWRGREAEAAPLLQATLDAAFSRGEGLGLTLALHAQAVLYNGLGRYEEALACAEQAAADSQDFAFSTWALVQLVEAAVRCGRREAGIDALERLVRTTRPSGTEWALGIEARSRALLADDDADLYFRAAIDHLGRTQLSMELARSQLLYGEWLRRRRRRIEAREWLRTAYQAFAAMGAEAFAERARRELLAAGETARAHKAGKTEALTAQEAQIAGLAARGRSNPEIGAELFLSPRTVEWHLRKVFAKLGITSRRQLRAALPDDLRSADT